MTNFRFSPKPNKAHLIKWRPWSSEAFDLAHNEGKPILLSLGAIWCHWCHVMDETTFSDQQVIDKLNADFICIRTDTDKRPDLQNRYIIDGWPTNAFLTDEGDIISGTTYQQSNEFLELLNNVSVKWQENLETIKKSGAERRKKVLKDIAIEQHSKLTLDIVDSTLDEYVSAFDYEHGGFGRAMKFPSTMTLELFMREAQVRGIDDYLKVATITLDNMAQGEIYDKEWGGFFRYATERDWSFPHFEKLLSENAGIIMNYLHAFEITRKPLYKEVAIKSLDYVNSYLANHPEGGFFGSQDADEKFYKLNVKERAMGNTPFIDKTFYTDWCSQMISTYVEAFRILNDFKYLAFAIDSMRFLLGNSITSMGAAHYYNPEEGENMVGLLQDQVWAMNALIDLYEFNPLPDYLTEANDIIDVVINRLAGNGAFFDKPKEVSDIGNLMIRYKSVKDNAVLALALKRFSVLTESKDFADMAENILSSFSFNQIKGDFISMAPYALAVSEVLGEEIEKAA